MAKDVAKITSRAEVADTPDLQVAAGADSCTFTHVSIGVSHFVGWSIDRLTVASPDIPIGFGKKFPQSLRVEATGVRFAPKISDSHARYLASIMQKPFDIRFLYDWDQQAGRLQVREIMLESPWIGRASLAMDMDLPSDPNRPGTVPHDADPAIRQIHFALDNRAIVESMLTPILVGLLPKDADPAIEFPKIQKKVAQQARKLPRSLVDDASKDALIRFVRDFPHPSGHFEETIRFDRPLRLGDLRSDKKSTWIQSTHIQAVYRPLSPVSAP